MKFAKWYTKFVKVGSKVYQILNKLLKNCGKFLRCCQSGEILPNLVTLDRSLSFIEIAISHHI